MPPKKDKESKAPALAEIAVDAKTLPRVDGKMTMKELREELAARGQEKGLASCSKEDLLSRVQCGTVRLTQVREYKVVQAVLQLIARERCELLRQQLDEEERAREERAATLERQQKEKLRQQLERAHALHTNKAPHAHSCPLGPTELMPSASGSSSRVESAQCDICDAHPFAGARCVWSCIKCDFDICARCFEVESLPPEKREAKRQQQRELERQRQQVEEQRRLKTEELAKQERKRWREEEEQEMKEASAKRARQMDAATGKVEEKHKKVPDENRKPSGSGFSVYQSSGYPPDGWHSYEGPPTKEFDSSWQTVADATKRAKYLFYVKNLWGLGVDEMLELNVEEKRVGPQQLIHLRVCPDDSEVVLSAPQTFWTNQNIQSGFF